MFFGCFYERIKKSLQGGSFYGGFRARPAGGQIFPLNVPNTDMAYAVIKTGGKQYRVQEGDTLEVEKLDADVDTEIEFTEVLLHGEGDSITVGAPFIDGAGVRAKVIEQFRCAKEVAFKFKRRKGYHKTKGYRRSMTRLEITSIG